MASILAASRDAIIATDHTGRITLWSDAAEHLYGFTAEEAGGRPISIVQPAGYETEFEHFLNRLPEATAPVSLRTVRRRKDGTLVEVEIDAMPVRTAAGDVTGYVALIRDISEQIRAEAVLEEMVGQLQVANYRLTQLSESKNDFVSTISHEFRTPLTSIQGFSELLDSDDLTLEEARDFVRAINQNAARLARLIGDVLDLDALETGHREIRTERLSLNTLIQQVLTAQHAMTSNHQIRVQLDPNLPSIRGDSDLLSRVVTNLVTNAVRYSPAGSVITIATALRHGDAEFTVSDEGIGVPAQHRETIFSRYGRIARPEQMGIEGTGLGLPIARHILEVHNGRIWVEPNTPAGSVFHVVIPTAGPDADS